MQGGDAADGFVGGGFVEAALCGWNCDFFGNVGLCVLREFRRICSMEGERERMDLVEGVDVLQVNC